MREKISIINSYKELSEFCCDNPNLEDIQDAISDFVEKIVCNRFDSITTGAGVFISRLAVSLAVSDVLAEVNK